MMFRAIAILSFMHYFVLRIELVVGLLLYPMAYHRYVILVSTFLCNALTVGYLYGMGRLLVPLIEKYQTTRAEASLVSAIFGAVICVFGIVAGPAIQRFGPKASTLVGVVLAVVPIGVSFFASSILFLLFTHAIAAMGVVTIYISSSRVLLMIYHGPSRHMALTCNSVGVGVGGMTYSYVLGVLADTYGLNGTFLILGGLMLNGIPLTLTWPGQNTNVKEQTLPATIKIETKIDDTKVKTRDPFSFKKTILHVIRIKSFIMFCFYIFFAIGVGGSTMFFLSDMMVDQNYAASLALLIFNLASNVGRVLPGVLKQIPRLSSLYAPLVGSVISAVGSLLLVFIQSKAVMLLGSALIGLNQGITMASQAIVVTALVGEENMAAGVGVNLTVLGIGMIISTPVFGFIRDKTGSYMAVFLCTTAVALMGSLCMLVAIWLRRRMKPSVITTKM